jgi:hypothetical protein
LSKTRSAYTWKFFKRGLTGTISQLMVRGSFAKHVSLLLLLGSRAPQTASIPNSDENV